MKKKKKVYIVELGPNNYRVLKSWPECQDLVHGKPYPYASGSSEPHALSKLLAAKKKQASGMSKRDATPKPKPKPKPSDYPSTGICSDAGTRGNPGPCEYQITDLQGTRLGHKHLGTHSNNFAELAGIGAMIQYAIVNGETVLWTDSKICMGWIDTGRIGKTVHERDLIVRMVRKIQLLLSEHPDLVLKKWVTKRWGQIPADFGRK